MSQLESAPTGALPKHVEVMEKLAALPLTPAERTILEALQKSPKWCDSCGILLGLLAARYAASLTATTHKMHAERA